MTGPSQGQKGGERLTSHQASLLKRLLESDPLAAVLTDGTSLGKGNEVAELVKAVWARGQRRILFAVLPGRIPQWLEVLGDSPKKGEVQTLDTSASAFAQPPEELFLIAATDALLREAQALHKVHWDLVILDEADRWIQLGSRSDSVPAHRYRLARALRNRAANILLLADASVREDHDKAEALLSLLDPNGDTIPVSMWEQKVVGARRQDAGKRPGTARAGSLLSRIVEIPRSAEERRFDKQFQAYLERGLSLGNSMGLQGLPVIETMALYRRLASSSLAALEHALSLRVCTLAGEGVFSDLDEKFDTRYVESAEDTPSPMEPFFSEEHKQLEALVDNAQEVLTTDTKLLGLLDDLTPPGRGELPRAKTVIYTEYSSTLAHIVARLAARFGTSRVCSFHLRTPLFEKRQAVEALKEEAAFLVTTEAGDGLELQRISHRLVNYDVPDNPQRLQERISRLYRYGQSRQVEVVTLDVDGSLDRKRLRTALEEAARQVGASGSAG